MIGIPGQGVGYFWAVGAAGVGGADALSAESAIRGGSHCHLVMLQSEAASTLPGSGESGIFPES